MVSNHHQALAEQVGYSEWRDRPPDDIDIFVAQLVLTGDELPAWRLDQVRSVRDGERQLVCSTWVAEADESLGVRVDVQLGQSRTGARDELFERLAAVQLPQLQRLPAGTVGDVGFVLGDNNVVLFSRGNLVVEVATLGSSAVDALAVARQFDDYLIVDRATGATGTPARRARRGARENALSRAALTRLAPGERTPLPESLWRTGGPTEGPTHEELGLPPFVPIAGPDAGVPPKGRRERAAVARSGAGGTMTLMARGGEIRGEDGRLWFVASDSAERSAEIRRVEPRVVSDSDALATDD
jgi:hypothetical protein